MSTKTTPAWATVTEPNSDNEPPIYFSEKIEARGIHAQLTWDPLDESTRLCIDHEGSTLDLTPAEALGLLSLLTEIINTAHLTR
ncbi:hypothetical protein CQ010_01455 [Arthrobacter sp. MYb211]|uniref:hypothetical protein n=1 Tax=unclassified Arthrobacter TaxID=235627 RepID=UPI000CFCA268|nr:MULTISPECIES: hypothetical protein [unclassified Arthrobacter]PRA13341.1 hypothetical protein CQ015_03710 [Arthrobacter sp. MYb221]PRC10538.1 hypothetical protein CQ010_01455 [Arthrobacter sp. MYb211]